MSFPRRRRAIRARLELIFEMGGKCERCSSVERLEFHVVQSVGGEHHYYDWSQRIRFYRSQLERGNLQLLCRVCHQRQTTSDNCKARALVRMVSPPPGVVP
jgi:5-methylcytosine-specific restriction endonuclease McrA